MTSGSSTGTINPGFEQSLKIWVTDQVGALAAASEFDWLSLNGDAGFRRYFRVRLANASLLAVYAPPATENNAAFLRVDRFLLNQGVHVPKILAHQLDEGFFLIEDLGESLYLECLNEDTAGTLYGEALVALLRIQQSPLDDAVFPSYDGRRLADEVALFPQWFVQQLLAHTLSSAEQRLLQSTFALLLDNALAQPKVVVHRDFHSRNLVYGLGGAPGIIDFQDAVIGPLTYDLVSLLKDCYIEWPVEQVRSWALGYADLACDAGVMPAVAPATFLRWFDLMGLQRHLKVLGIFARLSLRDQKHAYLDDLPLVVKYVRQVATRYRELADFSHWFDAVLLPLMSRQAWFAAGSP